MSFINAFIGVPQSRYAAFAVLTAILVVSLTILFGNQAVPLSQKFAFIFMLFLVSLPGILLSLFQLTCIVVGAGLKNQRPWCSMYAWIISILLIVYCALLIILAVISLTSGSKAMGEVAIADAEKFVSGNKESSMEEANKFATQMFVNEKFEGGALPISLSKSNIPPPVQVITQPVMSSAAKPPIDNNVPALATEPLPMATGPIPSKFTVKPPQKFEGGAKLNHAEKFTHGPMPKNTFVNSPMEQFNAHGPMTKPAGFANAPMTRPQKFTGNTQGFAGKINGQSDVYGDSDTGPGIIEPFDGSAATYSVAPQKFGIKPMY